MKEVESDIAESKASIIGRILEISTLYVVRVEKAEKDGDHDSFTLEPWSTGMASTSSGGVGGPELAATTNQQY